MSETRMSETRMLETHMLKKFITFLRTTMYICTYISTIHGENGSPIHDLTVMRSTVNNTTVGSYNLHIMQSKERNLPVGKFFTHMDSGNTANIGITLHDCDIPVAHNCPTCLADAHF